LKLAGNSLLISGKLMRIYTIERRQLVHRPLEEIFTFFSRPENLGLLTPKQVGFNILTPSPISMQTGALIDYTIKVLGIRTRWTTLITDFVHGSRFVDVQLKGPYAYWHHEHRFTETDDGTLITDVIHYAMPLGVFGSIIHELFVKSRLNFIFNYRAGEIEKRFHRVPDSIQNIRTSEGSKL
jgi:ligand-binding SRPBCC domain-containing protein